MEELIQKIAAEQAKQSAEITAINKRLDEQRELTESVHKLAISLERLTSQQKSTEDKVDGLTEDVEELKNKPAKRWDSVTSLIITAVITAMITFILTRLGLK